MSGLWAVQVIYRRGSFVAPVNERPVVQTAIARLVEPRGWKVVEAEDAENGIWLMSVSDHIEAVLENGGHYGCQTFPDAVGGWFTFTIEMP